MSISPRIRLSLILAVALISGLFSLSAPAAAQALEYNQCAVGWVAGPEYMVLTAHTTNQQGLVSDAAAACTDMIQSGAFVGVNKFTDWRMQGYAALCTITFNAFEGMDVYAATDQQSTLAGLAACTYWQQNGYIIRYW